MLTLLTVKSPINRANAQGRFVAIDHVSMTAYPWGMQA